MARRGRGGPARTVRQKLQQQHAGGLGGVIQPCAVRCSAACIAGSASSTRVLLLPAPVWAACKAEVLCSHQKGQDFSPPRPTNLSGPPPAAATLRRPAPPAGTGAGAPTRVPADPRTPAARKHLQVPAKKMLFYCEAHLQEAGTAAPGDAESRVYMHGWAWASAAYAMHACAMPAGVQRAGQCSPLLGPHKQTAAAPVCCRPLGPLSAVRKRSSRTLAAGHSGRQAASSRSASSCSSSSLKSWSVSLLAARAAGSLKGAEGRAPLALLRRRHMRRPATRRTGTAPHGCLRCPASHCKVCPPASHLWIIATLSPTTAHSCLLQAPAPRPSHPPVEAERPEVVAPVHGGGVALGQALGLGVHRWQRHRGLRGRRRAGSAAGQSAAAGTQPQARAGLPASKTLTTG